MNYSMLAPNEILRIAQPVTDLEVALFEIASDTLEGKVEELQEMAGKYEDIDAENDDLRYQVNELEDSLADIKHEIKTAIELIAEGNVDKAKKALEDLC